MPSVHLEVDHSLVVQWFVGSLPHGRPIEVVQQ